jgi:hypothetical protein
MKAVIEVSTNLGVAASSGEGVLRLRDRKPSLAEAWGLRREASSRVETEE